MEFPYWYQPRKDVGAILTTSQVELDALIDMGWPDVQCPSEDHPKPEPAPKRGPGRPRKEP